MYAREINGERYEFGVSGKLFRNVLIMYDRQTKSLWSQLLGAAVDGPLKGTRLEMLAASFTTWGVWRREHPDGMVLKKLGPSHQTYGGYWQSQDAGILGEKYQDERLKTKQFVLGVRINGQPKAYPYLRLSKEPVVNETFAETPLVVVFDDRSASGAIFTRAVAGKTLTFKLAEQTETAPLITDQETGTKWHGLSGLALEGQLAGQRLTAHWFGDPGDALLLVWLEGPFPQYGSLRRIESSGGEGRGVSCNPVHSTYRQDQARWRSVYAPV